MSDSQYNELDKLIKEYEEDFYTIRSDRLVMKNYPKVLVMSAASTFESKIKNRCQRFIDNPKDPLPSHYPKIDSLRGRKPKVDLMFAKFETNPNNGFEELHADKFYDLFGGESFKAYVITMFEAELNSKIQNVSNRIDGLQVLLDQDEKYIYDYAKQCDLKEELSRCTFEDAETAFLSLKLRRNRVAHSYLDGLSDTFVDLQRFYNKAILYVIALENSIDSLTASST